MGYWRILTSSLKWRIRFNADNELINLPHMWKAGVEGSAKKYYFPQLLLQPFLRASHLDFSTLPDWMHFSHNLPHCCDVIGGS